MRLRVQFDESFCMQIELSDSVALSAHDDVGLLQMYEICPKCVQVGPSLQNFMVLTF